MQVQEKKKLDRKPDGIAVRIMTKNKGLLQHFWPFLAEEDLEWVEVIEFYKPSGGKSLHSFQFSTTESVESKNSESPKGVES
jgi:hypothetical protein